MKKIIQVRIIKSPYYPGLTDATWWVNQGNLSFAKWIQRLLVFACFIPMSWLSAQTPTVALPSDGNTTKSDVPQGSLRYQRGFYLITPKEMLASGLVTNDTINCIGFTIANAQSDTTRGKFKVYLQNTTDTLSRIDTAWTRVMGITTNYYKAEGLYPAKYEWRLRTNCSPLSPIFEFSNDNLDPCRPPTHLGEDSITDVKARLTWVAPAIPVTEFIVEYTLTNTTNWTGVVTTNNYYTLTGLLPNQGYQWRVRTRCASDTSDIASSSFSTEFTNECSPPSGLTVVLTTDTLAKLKWTPASGGDYYSVRFRRLGLINWIETLSFNDSITINFGLVPGTTFEWQVLTNCGLDSVGTYISGPNFTTTGLTACYLPEFFSVDSITDSSALFTWDSVVGSTSYELWYRAKDVISWENAITPMALVHDDSIQIPDTIGPYDIPFKGLVIDTFKYSGKGLYIAWEYQDSLDAISSPNTSLATLTNSLVKGSYGQDSIRNILSFITRSDTSATELDSVLSATNYRPETRLCSPSLKDSVEVLAVYALGKYAPFYTSSPVSALIRNYSTSPQTYAVNMTVKDQNTNTIRYTTNQNLVVGPDTLGLIEFNGWTPSILETDSILISVPPQVNENVLNNNKNYYLQTVTSNIVSYEDGSEFVAEAGTDTSAGLTLSRHLMDGCGSINAVQIYLSQSSQDHEVFAIALDSNRIILAQSSPFTPDSTQVNEYRTFYFPSTRLLKDELYYIGLAQTASPSPYYPVGVQYESKYIRDSAYFRGTIDADSLWHHPYPGRLMIRANLVPGFPIPSITGDLFLCTGTTDTLVASTIQPRYADRVIDYSSQYSDKQYSAREALGTPDVYPGYGADPKSWFSATENGRQYLVLHFSNPDFVNFVDVFETFNPGSIDSVYVKDDGTGMFNLIWSGTASAAPQTSRKKRFDFPLTNYNVSAIRIAFNMDTIFGFSGIDAVCIGRQTNPGIFTSMLWTGGSTDDTLVVNTPGIYKLTTTDPTGCSAMDSVSVITPVQITPVITALGPTTFCPGDSVKIKSSIIGGNIWSTGETTDSIYVKTAGSYTVTYNDGTGCGLTMSAPVMVSLYTPVAVNITGITGICPGEHTTLYAGSGFGSYLWSTSETSDSIVVDNPGLYFITVTDNNGCKSYDTVTTTASPIPMPVVTGTFLFCPGDTTTLYASPGFSSYLWSTGATSDSIMVSTAGSFSVTVTSADGCLGDNTGFTSVYAPPFAVISGYDGYCPADSVQLIASGGLSFLWSTGSTAPSIQVLSSGSYALTVTDINGCRDGVSKNIIQFTPPSPFISGTLSFCGGGSVTALDAGLGYTNYAWSSGESSSSILVNAVGTYSVTVMDNNGCEGSTSATVTQDGGIPDIPGLITGSAFGMCNISSPSTYSISPVPNSTCYIWKVPPGATIVSGYMKDSALFFNVIQVVFDNSFNGGFIEVAAHNDCGSSPSFNGRRIYVSATPGSIPGIISGQKSGVCKQVATPYSITPIVGATSYLWSVPLGAMIVSGQGTPSIMVSFASSYRPGDICVQYSTLCGTSPLECISVKPIPETGNGITGPVVTCAFNQNTVYTIPLSVGASDYRWTVPAGASIVSGQGTNSIQVNFGNISGLVSVKASNDCGDGLFQFLLVNVTPCNKIPPTPNQNTKKKQNELVVSLFPNPSDGLLTLDLQTDASPSYENFTLSIYDPLNQLVYSSKISNASELRQTLDLRHFTKGLYFLQIQNKAQHYITKILLQ